MRNRSLASDPHVALAKYRRNQVTFDRDHLLVDSRTYPLCGSSLQTTSSMHAALALTANGRAWDPSGSQIKIFPKRSAAARATPVDGGTRGL